MLGLLRATDPRWTEVALSGFVELQSDHAHCEIKAAQNALSLVARYGGEHPSLVGPLSELAREETEHFSSVEARLRSNHGQLGPPGKDDYVQDLRRATSKDRLGAEPLLDRLLVAALIEARSCERFRLLSAALTNAHDGGASFYRELMASEARHYRLFRQLADQCFTPGRARQRWDRLVRHEAEIVRTLPLEPRIHG